MARSLCVSVLLLVNYTVFELGELATVPTVGGAYKVTCDALQAVNVFAAATGAGLEPFLGILISTVDAAVAIVVNRAIAYVVLVHEVYHVAYCLGIVGGISINLNVEDVTTTSKLVIGRLNLGLVLG